MTSHSERTAIVTGAAGGLGRALVTKLANVGIHVMALDRVGKIPRDVDVLPNVHWIECDVTDGAAVETTIQHIADLRGGIDILVNNAGLLSGHRPLEVIDAQEMRQYFEVNAVGPLLMVQSCLPYLRDSKHRGRIVNVASRTFFTGAPGRLAYVASKGALLGMTRVMANELGEHGITVNAAIPSQIATPGTREHSSEESFSSTMQRQALKEFVTPEDFAGLVAFLVSPEARMVTGQSIVCDGGAVMR